MRAALAAVVSAVLIAAAVVVFLLAVDVGRWQTAFARDDLRFRAAPTRSGLWNPKETVPFHAARTLLTVGDDVKYRHALRNYLLGRPYANAFAGVFVDNLRAETMVSLANYISHTRSPVRRGQIGNLLGVMSLSLSTSDDPSQRRRFLVYSENTLRTALAADPNNDDAKFNLEVTLRLLRRQPGPQSSAAPRQPGRAGAAALVQPGTGY